MSNFLRKLSVSNRNSLLRIIAIASAGSGLLYANSNSNSRANVAVKVPVALQESLSLPWPITQYIFPCPLLLSSDQWQPGTLPLFSSRVGSVPSSDIKNDNSEAVGGDPKPCCNCLGRDTIANVAARVGPAVVNLWFPHWLGFYDITNERIGSGTIIDQDGTILTCAHVVDNIQGKRGSVKGKVTRRSPADRAGFCPGDVVIEFDGKPVESIEEIIEIMGDRVGVPMKVAVKRAKDIWSL